MYKKHNYNFKAETSTVCAECMGTGQHPDCMGTAICPGCLGEDSADCTYCSGSGACDCGDGLCYECSGEG